MSSTTDDLQEAFAQRFIDRGRVEGQAEGRAKAEVDAILVVLAARGIEVSDELRERITGCTDHDQIATWLHRAATATKASDLLD